MQTLRSSTTLEDELAQCHPIDRSEWRWPEPHQDFKAVVIIPCYNEERRLRAGEFLRFLVDHPGVQFVFVDDGSKDDTRKLLDSVCSQNKRSSRVVALERNGGKAEAVRLGILDAIRNSRSDYVGFWDADLATPLSAIEQFIATLDSRPEIEMVLGSRVRLLGRQIRRQWQRHYLGRIFATAVATTLRLPVYDTQCGAKFFRVTPDLTAVFETPFLSRWIFDVEILARYRRLKETRNSSLERGIYEFPLEAWEDVAGSKLSTSDFFSAIGELAQIRLRYL